MPGGALLRRAESFFHVYVVRVPQRDAIHAHMREKGIGTGIHYPVPVHEQPAYQGRVALGWGGCPETETASRTILSLPLYPELTDEQVAAVCAALRGLT
jgi:dTDP-4-amino-4,6-dideoxygalactose transaminase